MRRGHQREMSEMNTNTNSPLGVKFRVARTENGRWQVQQQVTPTYYGIKWVVVSDHPTLKDADRECRTVAKRFEQAQGDAHASTDH